MGGWSGFTVSFSSPCHRNQGDLKSPWFHPVLLLFLVILLLFLVILPWFHHRVIWDHSGSTDFDSVKNHTLPWFHAHWLQSSIYVALFSSLQDLPTKKSHKASHSVVEYSQVSLGVPGPFGYLSRITFFQLELLWLFKKFQENEHFVFLKLLE